MRPVRSDSRIPTVYRRPACPVAKKGNTGTWVLFSITALLGCAVAIKGGINVWNNAVRRQQERIENAASMALTDYQCLRAGRPRKIVGQINPFHENTVFNMERTDGLVLITGMQPRNDNNRDNDGTVPVRLTGLYITVDVARAKKEIVSNGLRNLSDEDLTFLRQYIAQYGKPVGYDHGYWYPNVCGSWRQQTTVEASAAVPR
jgi:hypothetical protein